MRLSVVLISYNALHFLKPCLQALTGETGGCSEEMEIILVDNGSTDGTAGFIRSFYPEVKFIPLHTNKGVAYARNRGMETASGRYILLLDADTVPSREALDGMVGYMDTHPETGLCGARLVDPSGCVQDSCKRFPALGFKFNNILITLAGRSGLSGWKKNLEKRNRKYHYDNVAAIREPFSPDYLIGACQLIRKEVVEKTGLLDEHIFFGPEDADYCFRVRQSGWNVIYLPQFSIVHHWQRTTSRKIFSSLAFRHIQGLAYFYMKYRRIK